MQLCGLNLLIDPVFSARASPSQTFGPRRQQPPAIALAELPPIDAILLTHSHYDHMDAPALRDLARHHRCRLIAPLGNDVVVRRAGIRVATETADWWQERTLSDRLTVTLVPANHWSARTGFDRRRALWSGFALRSPHGLIYLAGDTGFGDGGLFRALRARLGAPRFAALPIGAYAPRWFMAPQHMDPEEAVEAFLGCGAAEAIGIHWGTFQLTDEAQDAPPALLAQALAARGIDPARFLPAAPGHVWHGT